MKKSAVTRRFCVVLAVTACAAAANAIPSVYTRWAFPADPMPRESLSGLQHVLRLGPTAVNREYHPVTNFIGLAQTSQALLAAGDMHVELAHHFGLQYASTLEAVGLDSPPARHAELTGILRHAYDNATAEVEARLSHGLQFLETEIRADEQNRDDFVDAARAIRPLALYGPMPQAHIEQFRKLAHASQSRAREIAARFAAGSAGDAPAAPRLASATRLDRRLDEFLNRFDLTMGSARDDDGPQIHAFINGIRERELGLEPSDHDFNGLHEKYDGQKGELLVVRDKSGQIVGTAAFAPFGRDGVCELQMMYIARQWRGRHDGGVTADAADRNLARLLLLRVIADANRNGYHGMELDTRYRRMYSAFRFYLDMGFMASGQAHLHPIPPKTILRMRHSDEMVSLYRNIETPTLRDEFADDFSIEGRPPHG